jgi:hypothetical protein
MTMIATLGLTGHTSAGTIRARLDLDTWEVYVTHKLVPILKAGDVVIMDNLNLHRSAAEGSAIEAPEARVIKAALLTRSQSYRTVLVQVEAVLAGREPLGPLRHLRHLSPTLARPLRPQTLLDGRG